jgi:hypothetical protein
MTPEGKIKEKVKKFLRENNVYFFMPVQSGYGQRTLDFLCCFKGRFIAIETKREGKMLTGQQKLIAEDIEAAGGDVLVVDSEEALKALYMYL